MRRGALTRKKAVAKRPGTRRPTGPRKAAARPPSTSASERHDLLTYVVETSAEAISIADRHGRLTYANRSFARMYGYEPEDLPGLLLAALDSPRNDPWIREEPSATAEGWSGVVYNTKRDGTEFPVALTTAPVRDAFGEFLGHVRVARDMTKALGTEEALLRSETQFRSIIEAALDAILTLTPQGLIESFNPAAGRLFGYVDREVRGQPIELLLPALLGSLGVLPRVIELDGVRKDGSRVPLEVSLSVLPTGSGHAVAAFVRDISERREIARLKDEFVTMVSHDLKTPLTSVGLSLALLLEERLGSLPARAREVVELAVRNVERMVKLADDVLDLKRIEAGRLEMRADRFPLGPLLNRCFEMVRPVAGSRGVSLEVAAVPADVVGDADRIAQVLTNLLSNAIKFSPEGGRVLVEVRKAAPWAEVRVSDDGPGIPAEHRARIFERFRQAPAPGAPKGSGLGLAIARAIVTQSGGEIGLEPREGRGSCFWFRLPLASRS